MNLERVGVYGGTFDPVHLGHLKVATALVELFGLDNMVFVPAFRAPHKQDQEVAPALCRFAMLVLATQNQPRHVVSTIELEQPERPYTVETLGRLSRTYGQQTKLYFVMGVDSWNEIDKWRDWETVLTMTNQIVVTRPGYEWMAEHIPPGLKQSIVDLRGSQPHEIRAAVSRETGNRVFVTDAVQVDISASAIRQSIKEQKNKEWRYRVPAQVATFIEKYRLYIGEDETRYTLRSTVVAN